MYFQVRKVCTQCILFPLERVMWKAVPEYQTQSPRTWMSLNVEDCPNMNELIKGMSQSPQAPESWGPRDTDRTWMSYVEGCWLICRSDWHLSDPLVSPSSSQLETRPSHRSACRPFGSALQCRVLCSVFCSRVLFSRVPCRADYHVSRSTFLCTGTMRRSVAHWHTYLAQIVPHLSGTKFGTLICRAGVLAPEHLWYAGGLLHTEMR